MPVQIDGKTPDTIRVGRDNGTLVPIGEARVWQDGRWATVYTSKRTATWSHNGGTSFPWAFVSGDPDLLTNDTSVASGRELVASVPVTVDKDIRTRNGNPFVTAPAGEVQPAGTAFQPASADVFTFTEAT